MKERLQKLLAQANVGSRRASEDLISAGRVRVNGAVAHLGDKADPAADVIEVDGTRLKFEAQEPIYVMLNKPKQVLSTDKPHKGDRRETVSHMLGRHEHLFSIGRLDADSEGLVVMTNDGDLAQRLSHPRYRHTKTYRVEVLGLPTAETIDRWQVGVFLEDGKTAPCFVEIVKGSAKGTILRVVMTEGKKRQIRRVASLLGHPVRRLTRTHIGMLALGDLEPGQSRELTPKEVLALKTPSPEIKALRAQPRRRPESETAPTDRPRLVRTTPDDENSRSRRSFHSRSMPDEETPRPRPSSRVRSTPDEERSRSRRSPRVRPEPDEKPRPRRASRSRPAEAADETPRPASRRKPTPVPGSEPPEKPRQPRDRKPESTEGSGKKRPPKPFAPFKNRSPQRRRKSRSGKDRQR